MMKWKVRDKLSALLNWKVKRHGAFIIVDSATLQFFNLSVKCVSLCVFVCSLVQRKESLQLHRQRFMLQKQTGLTLF